MFDEEDFYYNLCDRLTASELVEMLGLEVKDIWDFWEDEIIRNPEIRELLRYD